MSWNGSGTFDLIYNWEADAAANIDISAPRMDGQESDIASNGFGNTLTRDGQGSATANLPMNNFRHTGVANGVAATDYAALGQVLGGQINWAVAGGTSDAITATYVPAIATLTDGQLCGFRASAANTTTTPSFAPNGLTAYTITKGGGAAVVAGDIPGDLAECLLRYNLANTRWELLNPASNSNVNRTAVNDAAYNVLSTDRIIAYTAISTARVVDLIAAASFPVGTVLTIVDESGSCSTSKTITVTRASSDTIKSSAGSTTTFVLNGAYAWVKLESNGSNQWTVIGQSTLILSDQTAFGGAGIVSYSGGSQSGSGTYTVDPGLGALQYITNAGAFTLAAPGKDGSCDILVTNNGSASTVSFSGFTVGANTGDALDTTNTHKFIITVVGINSVYTYFIKALQ